jgi:hypothetical protein
MGRDVYAWGGGIFDPIKIFFLNRLVYPIIDVKKNEIVNKTLQLEKHEFHHLVSRKIPNKMVHSVTGCDTYSSFPKK